MAGRAAVARAFVVVAVGLGSVVVASSPASAAVATKKYTQVSVGSRHACARATDGTAICWGSGGSGQLGNGSTTSSAGASTPVAVKQAGTALAGKSISQIDAGQYFTCAVASGAAYCWGEGSSGQLGTGTSTDSPVAVAVKTSGTPLSGKTIKQVTAGDLHACAVATDGTVACWGSNNFGQVGDNTTGTNRPAPVAPTKTGTALAGRTASQVSAGNGYTCATLDNGNAACWGSNSLGNLGNGTNTNSKIAVAVTESGTALSGKAVTQVDAGYQSSTCARSSDGTAACWGRGSLGRLGNGGTANSNKAVAVKQTGTALAGKSITAVSVGNLGACAVTSDGLAACWGSNNFGTLGLGANTPASTSTALAVKKSGTALNGAKITGISYDSQPCAVASDGRVACWGQGSQGSLGDGGASEHVTNVAVGVVGTGPFAPFASFSALVTRLYTDLVGRAPTSSELSSWVGELQEGTSPGTLAASLRTSTDNLNNVDATTRLYRALLGRAPDPSGLKFWIGRRRSGAWTLVKMADYFASSTEFQRKYGTLTNRQFVTRIYTDVLGRPADPSGVDYWTRQLDLKRRSRGSVMVGFSESSEYKRQQAENTDVAVAYILLMGRAASSGETSDWVNREKGGTSNASLLAELLASAKYATHITG